MFSPQTKKMISRKVQAILQELMDDDELPRGEIKFILHVDGAEDWSWANIRNESDRDVPVPYEIVRNLSA